MLLINTDTGPDFTAPDPRTADVLLRSRQLDPLDPPHAFARVAFARPVRWTGRVRAGSAARRHAVLDWLFVAGLAGAVALVILVAGGALL